MAEYLKVGKIKLAPKLATALFYRINVLGVVHINDLIGVSPDNEGALGSMAQPAQFVPETTRISNGLLASR